MQPEPFQDSRRLTGCNAYFAGPGAALESAGAVPAQAALQQWRQDVHAMRQALDWPPGPVHARLHASGATLAFAAPFDQLYTATELNEWAWWRANGPDPAAQLPHAPGHAAAWDPVQATQTLQASARAEARPDLQALKAAADARGLPVLLDEDELSIGLGVGGRSWFLDELPAPGQVPWPLLHAIPTALVTGSNGKTTTVRLLAALCRAHGWHSAHSCTDGVFMDGREVQAGDFSGPAGAREALRQGDAQAAVLETARGGILRRGLALCRAEVAVVTNISADHFGEYGVHGLDELAATKLAVARAIDAHGRLVLNADDPVLLQLAHGLDCPLAWFAADFDAPLLAAQRAAGLPTCGVRAGHLLLSASGTAHDLGATAAMPLSFGDRAPYNIANLAAAALAAQALGIDAPTIAGVLARFGADPHDNPGRLQHWRLGEAEVFLDYAHNPEGLHGLLQAAGANGRSGRLALLLGHAGNREDADLRAVAHTAAQARPELVVLKDLPGYARGRAPGEVAGIMQAQLLADGVGQARILTCADELQAVRVALRWAGAGDLLVLPVHEHAVRDQAVALLDTLAAGHWRPGDPLP